MQNKNLTSQSGFTLVRRLAIILLAVSTLAVSGCSSSRVQTSTSSKHLVYNDEYYSVASVQRIAPRIEGNLANGDVKNMKGLDKKAVEALLKENSPLMVSMVIEMDSQEMVYRRQEITTYSEYSKMSKSFDKALNSIGKFMANKTSTQLKLK